MKDLTIEKAESNEGVGPQELLSKQFKHPVSIGYAALVTVTVFGFVALGMLLFDASLELMFLLSWIVVVPLDILMENCRIWPGIWPLPLSNPM